MQRFDGIMPSRPRRQFPTYSPPKPPSPRKKPKANLSWLFGGILLMAIFVIGLNITPKTDAENTDVASSEEQSNEIPQVPIAQGSGNGSTLEDLVILDAPTEESADQPTEEEPLDNVETDAEFTVRILNGGGGAGSAGKLEDQLKTAGLNVLSIGNANYHYSKTTIYYLPNKRELAEEVSSKLENDAVLIEDQIAEPADVLVVIGAE